MAIRKRAVERARIQVVEAEKIEEERQERVRVAEAKEKSPVSGGPITPPEKRSW